MKNKEESNEELKYMIDLVNSMRFFNNILPTIFVFVIGVGLFALGVGGIFYNFQAFIFLVLGALFILVGIMFTKTIPSKLSYYDDSIAGEKLKREENFKNGKRFN